MYKLFQKFRKQREARLRKQIVLAYFDYLKNKGDKAWSSSWILEEVDNIIVFIHTGKFKPEK